jgi:hypothetical protein
LYCFSTNDTLLNSSFSTTEDTLPKNIATSIKNVQFLDFFFARIRRIKDQERDLLSRLGVEEHVYPFVSPCGPELNFVRPADSAIVFHGLVHENNDSIQSLVFGGSFKQPFDPSRLAISRYSGRLYHELIIPSEPSEAKETTPLHGSHGREYGLIRSSVAVTLSEHIAPVDTPGETRNEEAAHSGMSFARTDLGISFSIPWLPEESEPGPWAMPFIEGSE